MMSIIDILRAKDRDDENYLLKDHIKETVERAVKLYEFTEKNKNFIEYEKFRDDNQRKEFFENLIIAAFLHDLGKINFHFQKNIFSKKERDESNEEWLQINNFFENPSYDEIKNSEVRDHEILSIFWSMIFLQNEERDNKIKSSILLHHYNKYYSDEKNIALIIDENRGIKDYLKFLCEHETEMIEILKELVKYIKTKIEYSLTNDVLSELEQKINFQSLKNLKSIIENDKDGLSNQIKFYDINIENPDYDFFVFLGALRRCDYSASGNVDIESPLNMDEIFKNIKEEIEKVVKENKGENWQEEILNSNYQKNLVLVAPTGSGKTEFALMWAEKNRKKLLYTLPLRVALNDLFSRFNGNGTRGYFTKDSVGILHSTSFIEYLNEERNGKNLDVDSKFTSSKLFSFPILLTTPDQVFLSSLKYYGFDKLTSIYPISSVVIDEIQAYNPEMAAIIIKTLDIIKKLGGSSLIITATFPPYFKKFIKDDLQFDVIDLKDVCSETKKKIKNYNLKRHKIELKKKNLFDYEEINLKLNEETFQEIKNIIENNKSKNIMLIVNNVRKAIDIYKKIEGENVELLHSRLIEKEKSERIKRIKNNLENKIRTILVATQIVEASVNVDFDILITEISTIDSQIQRWGRVYRNYENHKNEDYSDNEPNIIIFSGADKGTICIYDKRVIEKTVEVLEKYKNQTLNYEAEREMIEKVFEMETENKDGIIKKLKDIYEEEIEVSLRNLDYVDIVKRSDAQKLFRRIAGIKAIIPGLINLSIETDEVIKQFVNIINNENDKKSWKIIITDIIKNIKGSEPTNEEVKEYIRNYRWKFKELLYNYSINIPLFYFEKNRFEEFLQQFKGFYILNIKKQEQLEEIKKYGIDNLKNIDLVEIEEFENNIF